MSASSDLADVGVFGLAVMGQNLALNLADHGYRVAVANRTTTVTDQFVQEQGAVSLIAAEDLTALAANLARPRRILLVVKAGPPVDATLDALLGLLEPGDIVIDGGNSFWQDTERRISRAEAAGVHLVGAGISGGEEGARHGPSIMPGGSAGAWPEIREMLQAIAAKAPDGRPCCEWIGPGGSGHFVKMVHNGIEYGDMQVIAEAYDLMRTSGMSAEEMAEAFARFDRGKLQSYLIEITSQILRRKDDDGQPLDRQDPRRGRPEGHRTMGGRKCARTRAAFDPHIRGGVCPDRVLAQGGKGGCRRTAQRAPNSPRQTTTIPASRKPT